MTRYLDIDLDIMGAAFRISTNISNSRGSAGVFLGFGKSYPGQSSKLWVLELTGSYIFSHLEMIDI